MTSTTIDLTTYPLRRLARDQREADRRQAEAWQAERDARDAEERARRFAAAVARVLGADVADALPAGATTATIDGVALVASSWTELAVVGRCPRCGEQTVSEGAVSLAGLGSSMEEFVPNNAHRWDNCLPARTPAAVPPPPALAEQLADLIRAIVREEVTE